MKILLASLMCLVLTASECFALKGGPVYGEGGNIVGTYAGTLIPAFDPTDPISSNSIGIFSVTVPQSGLATGAFMMFAQGRTFNGTIRGTANPNKGSLRGILNATFNYTLTFLDGAGMVQTTEVTATVNGNLSAKVHSGRQTVFTSTATLLRGEAILFIDQGQVAGNGQPILSGVISLTVDGFRQSSG
jgi:hypothetical protein